ncbi:conserved hypothetical protein [Trichinella spiralis]|uniref:hypothetical protein n=1 Tax=Trichinella spiralis TaxID=6334 RepID=UPI0001EFE443|nr:conserved hypothetical protein [Trichinella spiralis]
MEYSASELRRFLTKLRAKASVLQWTTTEQSNAHPLSTKLLFRTEQHRPSRCDLAKGWCPEVAGRPRTIPAHSPARSLSGLLAALSRGQRGPPAASRSIVVRETMASAP